jgi:DNA-directed RNA polymerase subunit RPC12/RpoP
MLAHSNSHSKKYELEDNGLKRSESSEAKKGILKKLRKEEPFVIEEIDDTLSHTPSASAAVLHQRHTIADTELKDIEDQNLTANASGTGNLNGIDWKITMLDGTQTVELNMADEMGKQKKTHVCLFCGKIYNRKYGLKIHLRTHTGYKPLKCKVCSRPFSDPSNLNKHVRLHSQGETPYKCMWCGKILVRKRDLDRHIMSRHSGHREINRENKADNEHRFEISSKRSRLMHNSGVDNSNSNLNAHQRQSRSSEQYNSWLH